MHVCKNLIDMRRTTISLPDDLLSFIDIEAHRRRIPVSQLVREVLEDRFVRRASPPAFIGMFDDDRLTQGADVEKELERTWADAIRSDM
jgi:hypothetical protein